MLIDDLTLVAIYKSKSKKFFCYFLKLNFKNKLYL